jgi:hypothetical protein
MKNNKDFTYAYSDINLFQTKVTILTGKYKDIELEFASSGVMSGLGKPLFNFEYQLYKTPDDFEITNKFEDYLTNLLIAVIDDRNNDSNSKEKLDNASTLGYEKSTVPYLTVVRKLSYFNARKLIKITFKEFVQQYLLGLYINLYPHKVQQHEVDVV